MKRYLQKFLEELPKQTMFDRLEVVLDHNEPDEEEISWVKEFQKKYPGRIRHIINAKVSPLDVAWNRCIKESSGKYLTTWNIDDLRAQNSIELQYNELEKNPAVGMVYGNFKIVRVFGATEGRFIDCTKYPATELTRSFIGGPFFMFRKSLCEKAGYFDEQLLSGGDFDLSVRLALHTKSACVDKILGYFLNEGKGLSTRPDSKQALDRTTIELRYGIYDKIDYSLVPKSAATHNVPNILEFGQWVPVSKYVPDYDKFLADRKKKWFAKGLRREAFRRMFFTKQIKIKLKSILKPILVRPQK
jgi:glycosyltransferase involved in cell wall biosynthesis